jgi:thioredoxin 1
MGILTARPSPYQSDHAPAGESRVSENVIHVTDSDFEERVLNADGPVLVDYWAEWCGPCKMIAPIIDEIAKEYEGRLTVAKLDIDSNSQTPQQYSVRGIPTLMIFRDGNVQGTKVGAMTMGHLKAFVEETI